MHSSLDAMRVENAADCTDVERLGQVLEELGARFGPGVHDVIRHDRDALE
ncbi:hypothetical protein ACIRSU_09025 [Streptomyces sp. NPDC101160]